MLCKAQLCLLNLFSEKGMTGHCGPLCLFCVYVSLFEKLWSEDEQILAPVAPEVAACRLVVSVLEVHAVELLHEGLVVLVVEVGVAYSYPVELVACLLLVFQLLVKILVGGKSQLKPVQSSPEEKRPT